MPKFLQEVCEVCSKPVSDWKQLPPELQKEVYRPGAEEHYDVDEEIINPGSFGE